MAAKRGRQFTTFGGLFTPVGLDGASEVPLGEPIDLTLHDRDLALALFRRAVSFSPSGRSISLTLKEREDV